MKSWFWVSVANPFKPRGQQAQGVIILNSEPGEIKALVESKPYWPKGPVDVMVFEIDQPAPELVDRLISPKECLDLDIGQKFTRTGQTWDSK
jgi:hypothetical protein